MTEPYNAAERQHVKAAAKSAKEADGLQVDFIRASMATRQGRAWFWAELAAAQVFVSSFDSDPLRMAFLEGKRSLGLALLDKLTTHTPDDFVQMMREANARSDAVESRQQPASEPASAHDEPTAPAGSDSDGDGWRLAFTP